MRVRMLVSISGTHDGQDWPRMGGIADVSGPEAEHLIAGGLAVEVAKDASVIESATVPEPISKATVDNSPRGRKGRS